jgi:molybdopterin-guanine dinucleotide biosynthesis protein A
MDIGDISAVILAGGANTRFGGKTKANAMVGGERIIISILNVIGPVFDDIVIVTNSPEEFSGLRGCTLTGDHFKGKGPLGGIHAGMRASTKEAVFVFAADMPFLDSSLILAQAESFVSDPSDVLVPRVNGNIEPLHSIYRAELATGLEEFLREGSDFMIRSFLKKVSVRYFDIPENEAYKKAFTNINYPSDIA